MEIVNFKSFKLLPKNLVSVGRIVLVLITVKTRHSSYSFPVIQDLSFFYTKLLFIVFDDFKHDQNFSKIVSEVTVIHEKMFNISNLSVNICGIY